jgi:hypothetical protein
MATYNIIYTSPDKDIYLWTERSLTKINSRDRENLKYSGKSIKDDGLEGAIEKCRLSIKSHFPTDTNPKIKLVQIDVSN